MKFQVDQEKLEQGENQKIYVTHPYCGFATLSAFEYGDVEFTVQGEKQTAKAITFEVAVEGDENTKAGSVYTHREYVPTQREGVSDDDFYNQCNKAITRMYHIFRNVFRRDVSVKILEEKIDLENANSIEEVYEQLGKVYTKIFEKATCRFSTKIIGDMWAFDNHGGRPRLGWPKYLGIVSNSEDDNGNIKELAFSSSEITNNNRYLETRGGSSSSSGNSSSSKSSGENLGDLDLDDLDV